MLDQSSFRKLIASDSGGLTSQILRTLLGGISYLYSTIVRWRNRCYDKGWLPQFHAPVAVISVGNITAGGTGKTPIVVWLCNKFQGGARKIAILTRGYKTSGTMTDEPALLAAGCPGARVIIDSDRASSARTAIQRYASNLLVMDDGFQHRKLSRNLDIIAIDATCPFGYGKLLPAGLLREPPQSLARAHAVIITRADLVSPQKLGEIEAQLLQYNPRLVISTTKHMPYAAIGRKHSVLQLQELEQRKVYAFCGIGNPEAFRIQLRKLEFDVLECRNYADHHSYKIEDLTDIYEEGRYLGADIILTTEKDWVKIEDLLSDEYDISFFYLAIKLEFISDEDTMVRLIQSALKQS